MNAHKEVEGGGGGWGVEGGGWGVEGRRWRVGVEGRARVRPQNGGRPRLESRDEITGLCWLLSD